MSKRNAPTMYVSAYMLVLYSVLYNNNAVCNTICIYPYRNRKWGGFVVTNS